MELSLTQDVSMIQLVAQASWVVKLVMLLLLAASMASWWIVFAKFQMLRRENRLAREFEHNFWEGKRDDLVITTRVWTPIGAVSYIRAAESMQLKQPASAPIA